MNNGNAIILQVAFSYDTLVESKEKIEEEDQERGTSSAANTAHKADSEDKEGNIPIPDSTDSTDRRQLDGYYGSAVDILGFKGEIDVVRREFDKQRAIDRLMESRNGRAGKRRVCSG
jgi:hypothetical protein